MANSLQRLTTSALLIPLLSTGACSLFGGQKDSLTQVDDLVSRVEQVHVEAELAKERTSVAMDRLRGMVKPGFDDDPILAHAELKQAVEQAQGQAEDLRGAIAAMKKAADPVFKQWTENATNIKGANLRQRSEARMATARHRYDAVLAAAEPAQATYDQIVQGLNDHVLFLGTDFNTAAIADVKDEFLTLERLAKQLQSQLDGCLQTARVYVDSAALPMRVELARPEPK